MTKRQYLHVAVVLLSVITTVIIISRITRQGIGVTPDSVSYLSASDNLIKGNGLISISGDGVFVPMTHFPPLYPILMAAGEFIGIRALEFCNYLNILVFILNVIFFGVIVYLATDANIKAACFGSLFMVSSFDIFRAHICAMTDPIFIFLTLTAFFTFTLYLDKKSITYLIACSLLVSLSFLLRYVGLSLILTISMGILILDKRELVKKIADGAIFLAISTIPMVLWLSRNLYLTGNPFNRTLGYYQLSLNNFPEKVGRVLQKLGYLPLSVYLAAIVGFILMTLLIIYWVKPSRKIIVEKLSFIGNTPYLIGIFILNYLLVVIIAVFFFDNAIYLGFRILLPIIVFGELLILIILARYLSYKKLLIFALIIIGLQLSRWDFNRVYQEELVYGGAKWAHSAIIKQLSELPDNYKIYSNGHDVIYYFTKKLSHAVPEVIISDKNIQNLQLSSELKDMSLHFNNGKFVLVWLDNITWRKYLATKDSLVSSLRLKLVYQAPDGSIYTSQKNLEDLRRDRAKNTKK